MRYFEKHLKKFWQCNQLVKLQNCQFQERLLWQNVYRWWFWNKCKNLLKLNVEKFFHHTVFFYHQHFLKSILFNVLLKKIICGVLHHSKPLASLQNVKYTCGGMLFFNKFAFLYFTLAKLKITLFRKCLRFLKRWMVPNCETHLFINQIIFLWKFKFCGTRQTYVHNHKYK